MKEINYWTVNSGYNIRMSKSWKNNKRISTMEKKSKYHALGFGTYEKDEL